MPSYKDYKKSPHFQVQLLSIYQQFILSQMSRNSRLGHRSPNQMFSLSHHEQYAISTTYFPRCYSYIGSDIFFPTTQFSFLSASNTKLSGAGTLQKIQKQIQQNQSNLQNVRTVSLSIPGVKCQQDSTCMNMLTFCSTILCFCFNPIMRTSCYRDRFYTKYSFDQYEQLIQLVNKVDHAQTLIIHFQDNLLNKEKLDRLDKYLVSTKFKRVILRNMSYFIEVESIKEAFPLLKNKAGIDFKFIWQQFLIVSASPCDNPSNNNTIANLDHAVS